MKNLKLFSKRSKYNNTDSINNLFNKKAKFNSLYGKSFDEYKKLEKELEINQNNVSNLLIELTECKEKLLKTEQKNQIIQSKNRVIKAEKIEKIIKVLEKRNLMIESTGFKERIPQMSDEMINSLYDLISNYIQIEKNIYNKLMEGYMEILNSQPISEVFKIKKMKTYLMSI